MTHRALVAVLLAASLAACGDDPAPFELELTAPASTVEILPGGSVELAWTVSGPAELVITLIPLNEEVGLVIFDDEVSAGDGGFTWDGRDVDGTLVPPDVYDLEVVAFVDGDPVDQVLRNLSVHGVVFTDPGVGEELTIVGSDLPQDIIATTVSQRVIQLAFSIDPDDAVDGDEHVIFETSIPGEFVPFPRWIHFDGFDVADVAIPGGDYRVVCDVVDADDDLAYQVTGGILHWQPAAAASRGTTGSDTGSRGSGRATSPRSTSPESW